MRLITLPDHVDPPPADDPYRYGSRCAIRIGPDGKTRTEMVPLTLWDFLHPQLGDHLTRGSRHKEEVSYLATVIASRLSNDPQALVASELAIHWETPGLTHHVPDVAVLFGVCEPKKDRLGFTVSQEATRPELILEVISPHAREADTVVKMSEYHFARLPFYAIIDRIHDDDTPVVRGYVWRPGVYEPVPLDDNGRLPLPKVGLSLGVDSTGRIRLYDAATGEAQRDD